MQIGGFSFNSPGPTATPTSGPSVKHSLGQFFGHALNALPGYSSLGANITNPNVNYLGVPNPGHGTAPAPRAISQPGGGGNIPGADTIGGQGGGGRGPVVDPLAQVRADYNRQVGNTYGSIYGAVDQNAEHYNNSILDYLDSARAGQKSIDSKAVQNELSKRQGTAGVLDMIGHGIRSGGVLLANKNASSSSATDALGRAYSDIGRRQQTGVNNQYEQGNNAIQDSQEAFNIQQQGALRGLGQNKNDIVNDIVNKAQDALTALNSSAQSATLPDRIDIESEKQRIKNAALGKLQQYDQTLNNGVASIRPQDATVNRTKAAALDTAGTAADNAFSYDAAIPAQFQDTGPFASELPIFTFPGSRKQTARI